MNYFYKYVNGDKWIQINGEGDDPKNCKINWDCSKNNMDIHTVMLQKRGRSPLYNWVKFDDPKIINDMYTQVLKINPLLREGYKCVKHDIPNLKPPLPDPIIPESDETKFDIELTNEKVSINKSELSHKGLVLRDVEVKRGGKTFTQKRWVKPGEDEPEPKKSKKDEVKGKGKYNIGDKFNFLGNKFAMIDKIDEKEQTIKLNDGKVYTFEAIELGKKGISGGKYNIGDKVKFDDDDIRSVTYINPITNNVEFDNGGTYTLEDIEKLIKEKPKKEPSIKDLKPIKKEKPKSEPKLKDDKIIKGSAKDGSLTAKECKEASKNMEDFMSKLEDEEKDIDKDKQIQKYAKFYTGGFSYEWNYYLMSDKNKRYDHFEEKMVDLTPDEKEELEDSTKKLDEFLDRAPKVKSTVYRTMAWNFDDPMSKDMHDSFMSDLKVGKIIESKAYSSTTTSKKVMEEFGGTKWAENDVFAQIEYESKSGVYLDGQSKYQDQKEVLFKPNTKFEVVEITPTKNKKMTIRLREVDLNE